MMSLPGFGSLCLHLSLLALALSGPLFLRARGAHGLGLSSARHLFSAATALLTAGLLTLSLAALVHDFRIEYVISYSDRTTSIPYLLCAVWAGQAGSLMVWAAMLGWMSIVLSGRLRRQAPALEPPAMGFLSLLLGFFVFVLVGWSNPFAVIDGTPPVDGSGLNPLLRNVLMIFHPPALLAGYAAYGPPAAITAAALLTGKIDKTFLRELRHWALIAWVFLSVGNLLGMLWAYEELGWGGYWGWDPVENASLIPWLTGTVLLHLLVVERKARILRGMSIVLAFATFWLTLLGTYLTRSGVVASVHAFGRTVVADAFAVLLVVVGVATIVAIVLRRRSLSPPTWAGAALLGRAAFAATVLTLGLELEGIAGVLVAPALLAAIVGWRTVQPSLRDSFAPWFASYLVAAAAAGVAMPTLWLPSGVFAVILFSLDRALGGSEDHPASALFSRAKLLMATVWLISLVAFGVLFGTVLPVISRIALGEAMLVDAGWYTGWAAPAGLLVLALTGTCLCFGWRSPGQKVVVNRLTPSLVGAAGATLIAWSFGVTSGLALGAVGLAGMAGVAAVLRALRLFRRAQKERGSDADDAGRVGAQALRIMRSFGATLAHLGLAVFLFGVSGEAGKREETIQLSRDDETRFGPFQFRLDSVDHRVELDREELGAFVICEWRGRSVVLLPERHRYRAHANQPTSEAAVLTTIRGDLFLTLGEVDLEEQTAWVRAVWTPLLPWIWLGCGLMAFGGLLVVGVSVRLRRSALVIMAATLVGVIVIWLAWRPSGAVIAATGASVIVALWWLGQALLRPLWQPVPELPKCPSCDAPLVQSSRYCHRCGAEVDDG